MSDRCVNCGEPVLVDFKEVVHGYKPYDSFEDDTCKYTKVIYYYHCLKCDAKWNEESFD